MRRHARGQQRLGLRHHLPHARPPRLRGFVTAVATHVPPHDGQPPSLAIRRRLVGTAPDWLEERNCFARFLWVEEDATRLLFREEPERCGPCLDGLPALTQWFYRREDCERALPPGSGLEPTPSGPVAARLR